MGVQSRKSANSKAKAAKLGGKVKPKPKAYVRTPADLEAVAEYDERLRVQGPRLPHMVTNEVSTWSPTLNVFAIDRPIPIIACLCHG